MNKFQSVVSDGATGESGESVFENSEGALMA